VTGFPLLDVVLLVAFVLAAVRGARQGALSQVAAFGGAAVGLVVGAVFGPSLAARFVDGPGPVLALLTLALLAASILIGQAVGFSIGVRLRTAAHTAGIGALDRTAGVVVGLVSLLVVVWLLASALQRGPLPFVAAQVSSSRIVEAVGRNFGPAPDVFSRLGTYLTQQGFPEVFSGLGSGATAPPVAAPGTAAVQAAQAAAQASTVQVQAPGCGAVSSGSGFVTAPGFVVTNAHVVSGGESVTVLDPSGTHDAVPVLFDPALDLAVLAAPGTTATPLPFTDVPSDRGVEGATLGFPGGQRDLAVKPAAVRGRSEAVGRDIYGRGLVSRDILTLGADVVQGDSGGPFVTSTGQVGGVVFAAAVDEPGVGYALTAERVAPLVAEAVARNTPVGLGECRY